MKQKFIRICDKKKLENTITDRVLYIDDNLFTIDRITTILKPEETTVFIDQKRINIVFSYSDKCLPMVVNVAVDMKDDSALAYVAESKLLNDLQLETIVTKIEECIKEDNLNTINELVLTETLNIITQAINKADIESTKNDFLSKFDLWKDRVKKENDELAEAANNFFKDLVFAKAVK